MSFLLDPDRDDDYTTEVAAHWRLLDTISADRVQLPPQPEHCPTHGTYQPTHWAELGCPGCDEAAHWRQADDIYDARYQAALEHHDN